MLNIVHVMNRVAVDGQHQVAHQDSGCSGRRIGFYVQHQQSLVDSFGEVRAQSLGYRNGLHGGAEKGARHVAPFQNCIHDSIDGRCRYGDDCVSRQRRAVDPQNATAFVHQRAAGLAYVELQIRTDKPIHLSTAPGTPTAAQAGDDSCAGRNVAQSGTAYGQHHLAHARWLGADGLRRACLRRLSYAKHSEIGSRIRAGERGLEWITVVSDLQRVAAAESLTHRHDHSGPPDHPARSGAAASMHRHDAVLNGFNCFCY